MTELDAAFGENRQKQLDDMTVMKMILWQVKLSLELFKTVFSGRKLVI